MLRSAILIAVVAPWIHAADPHTTVADLVTAMRARAKALEGSSGMKSGYESFLSKFALQPKTVSYSDYAVARLLYESTRDAGLWNLHWVITDKPPNSDNVWHQWKTIISPSVLHPTAYAECDELSALYAFLMARSGIRGVGLLWPTYNHTVATWVLNQSSGAVRVVIPTTQIFLEQDDYWGTKKFDPWRQKLIHEYGRRDVPDSFELPAPLFDFFLRQAARYGGASDQALQLLRYWRESVFLKGWTPQEAAREALRVRRNRGSAPPEDLAAFDHFAEDMQAARR